MLLSLVPVVWKASLNQTAEATPWERYGFKPAQVLEAWGQLGPNRYLGHHLTKFLSWGFWNPCRLVSETRVLDVFSAPKPLHSKVYQCADTLPVHAVPV